MARFRVKAGLMVIGSSENKDRKVYKKDDVFETTTEKQTAFCDKDHEKFERVSDPVSFRRTVSGGKVKSGPIKGPFGIDNRIENRDKPTEPFQHVGETSEEDEVEEVEVDLAKLDQMTEPELRQFATEYGIQTGGAKDRGELLKNIKAELNRMG